MSTEYEGLDPTTWRPQARFRAAIGSLHQLKVFNDTGGIAVFLDVTRSTHPDITIVGSQNQALSFWDTRSRSGFVTKPKFSAGLLTIRFVTSGQITYLGRYGEIAASPSIAALTGFDDLIEVRASSAVSALSATIPVHSLVLASIALMGEGHHGLLSLEPIADMARPGMSALFCTIHSIQNRLHNIDHHLDLLLPLFQEVMSYQLLSVWPRSAAVKSIPMAQAASRQLRLAIDYIESNLAMAMTLAEIADSAGISVRSLQIKFKKETGRTPIEFITERRLTRAHEELVSTMGSTRSISDIARSWGFAHMSDFGQRYRRQFGCTPSQTRSNTGRKRQND